MTKQEKNRTAAPTAVRWKSGSEHSFNRNYTTLLPPIQVAYHLLTGEKNAIPSRELVRLCGFRTTRELQAAISREREAGALILSTCRRGGGYFLPSAGEEGKREISLFVTTLTNRAINTLRSLQAAKRELNAVDGQISLEEIEVALMSIIHAHNRRQGGR